MPRGPSVSHTNAPQAGLEILGAPSWLAHPGNLSFRWSFDNPQFFLEIFDVLGLVSFFFDVGSGARFFQSLTVLYPGENPLPITRNLCGFLTVVFLFT